MGLKVVQMSRPSSAVAAAVTLLSRQPPFDRYPLRDIVGTVTGAVERGHYVFTMDGEKICGFGCWALTDDAAIARWSEGGGAAPDADGRSGDVVALMMAVGEHPGAPAAAFRHAAGLYPGMRYVFRRTSRGKVIRGRFPARAAAVPGAPATGA